MNELYMHTAGLPLDEGEARFINDNEWLVTNGLGGYASGTIGGTPSRVFHGYLIGAEPSPKGRTMLLNQLLETVYYPETEKSVPLNGLKTAKEDFPGSPYLQNFRLDAGMPVWTFDIDGLVIEKCVYQPRRQNTTYIHYSVVGGSGAVELQLRPAINFRGHEEPVNTPLKTFDVTFRNERLEISAEDEDVKLRLLHLGKERNFSIETLEFDKVQYEVEHDRGYIWEGKLWSPGVYCARLAPGCDVTLVASTQAWEIMSALSPREAWDAEGDRKRRLLLEGFPELCSEECDQLVWAADQFLFSPVGRREDTARARAAGDEIRSVIAGYHWFTDWGRDTMISLEGLTLATGRAVEANYILRTFAHYIKDGLIPNMFPEGRTDGLYHTADATLWFFQALNRYVQATGDRHLLHHLLPKLLDIVGHHLRGTRFGIHVDHRDGLLVQGEPGYQLTWMDAKVGDWVVTPRRGKAVEINALWYNALCLMEHWLRDANRTAEADGIARHAEKARQSFNERFWNEDRGFLFDVIDSKDNGDIEDGASDPACRPNQLFSISLEHPVLDESRWKAVVRVAKERLLTPVGLRSLAPGEPNYRARYDGDLRSRDAAYHQGTVWGWLIGPFVDSWLKVYPDDTATARGFLDGFNANLRCGCMGSINEIFDAEPPFTPRGCCAQAWSIAEVLRCHLKVARLGVPDSESEALLTASVN